MNSITKKPDQPAYTQIIYAEVQDQDYQPTTAQCPFTGLMIQPYVTFNEDIELGDPGVRVGTKTDAKGIRTVRKALVPVDLKEIAQGCGILESDDEDETPAGETTSSNATTTTRTHSTSLGSFDPVMPPLEDSNGQVISTSETHKSKDENPRKSKYPKTTSSNTQLTSAFTICSPYGQSAQSAAFFKQFASSAGPNTQPALAE